MNILVTGATGFLGSHLLKGFLNNTNHNIKDLNTTREVIRQYYPEYLDAFDHVMKHTKKGSFYNMF